MRLSISTTRGLGILLHAIPPARVAPVCYTSRDMPVESTRMVPDVRLGLVTLALAGALSAFSSPSTARTWHVPGDAATIAAALDSAAVADTVEVACGTYLESDLVMTPGVVLRSETGQPDCVTLDAQGAAGHLYLANLDSTTVVEGITFTGGWGTYTGHTGMFGGALRCENASPRIRHCDFLSNSAVYGGAIYVSVGSPSIRHCRFEQNDAVGDGAITVAAASVTVDSCSFADNTAFEGSGAVWGSPTATLTIRDCSFLRNVTTEEGGAITSRSGALVARRCLFEQNQSSYWAGGVAIEGSGASVTDCDFRENTTADRGGAIALSGSGHLIRGGVFDGNVSASYGGAIHSWAEPGEQSRIESCTFHGNDADLFGASAGVSGGGVLEIDRSILAFASGGGAVYVDAQSTATLTCTDIYGNVDGDWVGPLAGQQGVAGNFADDPRFCDPGAGDLTLHEWSPCLPQYSPCGVQIGALGMGCPATAASPSITATRLLPSHPNPFNPRTTIHFQLAQPAHVELSVYDVRGRRLITLADGPFPVGENRLIWNGHDEHDVPIASGVYLIRFTADGQCQEHKVSLLR
jgi:hypothetical protein